MTTTEQLYTLFLQHPLISTDTRKILPGSLFFALKGEKFDANTFAEKALEAGAAYSVIDNATYQLNEKYLLVDDVLIALQGLARHHRKQLKIPVIGLTGTNGKTTTKELINSVLSQQFKTKATQGNLNNHIGVPLTLLTVDQTDEIAVIEMGANHQKEIALLCSIAQPTHGLITNVGKAHLEGFGGVEGVKKGKGELYDFLKTTGGIAFVNTDSYELIQMQLDRGLDNVYNYGTRSDINFVYGRLTENGQFLSLKWKRNNGTSDQYVKTHLTGAYNLGNILAAISIGAFFKLTDDEINRGVTGYQPQNNRSQIVQTATNTLICDYYNANPSSMIVAIENIGKMKADKKVLILGDMFELGDEAAAEHLAIIKKAMETPADARIFIGKEFDLAAKSMDKAPPLLELAPTNREAKIDPGAPELVGDNSNKGEGWTTDKNHFYETAEDAVDALKTDPIKNATVLIKGSRGMALERLVEFF